MKVSTRTSTRKVSQLTTRNDQSNKQGQPLFMRWLLLLLTLVTVSVQAQTTINSSGTYTVPPGVTSIKVYLWGGGGGGAGTNSSGTAFLSSGGGGGGAMGFTTIAVTPGEIYTVTIGSGGAGSSASALPGANGGTTTFSGPAGTWTVAGGIGAPGTTTNATGATNPGGAGASTGTGTGIVVFAGGTGSAGANGTGGTNGVTGNGGGGAGSAGPGVSPATACGVTGFGGSGTFPGGNGGVSPNCAIGSADMGSNPGVQPGGGGSGTKNWLAPTLPGGNGGAGRVVVVTALCASPTNQPTALSVAPVSTTQINGSFTAAAGADGYLVVRYPSAATPTDPVDNTAYGVGSSLGAGTVVSAGGTSFTSPGLTPGLTYDFYVYAMNSSCVGGPLYRVTSPLTGSASTPLFSSSTAKGGLWSSPATWALGVVPPAGENVVIVAGSTVTVDQLVTVPNLTVNGILQWNATANAMTITGNLLINSGGRFLPYTTGAAGVIINIAGNLTNNGYVNASLTIASGFLLNFNGLGSTIDGTGTFQGSGTDGFIRSLGFQALGSNTINTSQNLVVTTTANGFALLAGSLNTNGKLKIDNTRQVYGQAFNQQVQSLVVTNMGSTYSVAPVVYGVAVTQWTNITGTLNTLYVSGNNVYRCTAAANIGPSAPTHTSGISQNLLWISTVGTLGNPFQVTANTVGTQYFYGGNLYTCINAASVPLASAPPTCTSGTCVSGGTTYLYVGSPATATVNYDGPTQTVRSLNLTSQGSGYANAGPGVAFSLGVAGGTGSGAAATAMFFQQIIGSATSLFQKTGGTPITGGIAINSDQGVSVATAHPQGSSGVGALSTTNGGVNYTVAPTVGFALPPALNLITNPGSGYLIAPTVTVTGGNLVTGSALTTANFTITVNQGKVESVYLNTGTTATYSTLPTLTLTASPGVTATLEFPIGCLPVATAVIGSNGQLTNFNISNPGFGYPTAPTVGIGTTTATANGGTFTTVASAPSARIASYNLTLNFFAPATSVGVNADDASIPTNRKLNNLSLAGNGLGIVLTNNLTLFGTTPFALNPSTVAPGHILDLGGNNLNFTWNGFAGVVGTFGATNSYIKNGSMSLTGRGGGSTGSTFNFPFSGTFTWTSGTTPTNVTTGTTITRVTVTQLGAPTGPGSPIGTRAYRVQTDAGSVYGLNPLVTMNFNTEDALSGGNTGLFISQAPSLAGTWVLRSASSGSGPITPPGSRTTATSGNGPVVPTGDDYYAWAYPAPVFANVTVPTGTCPASNHVINADITTPTGTITTVTLNYNNGAAGSTTMSFVSGNTYTGTIPAATTPTNAVVSWSITATSSIGVPTTFTGSTYKDDYLNGLILTPSANPVTICVGGSSTLSTTLSTPAAPSYTAPPAVTNPTFNLDFGNITITQGASTILNNTTAENTLNGTIGTATGTAGSYSNFTAFGPYALTAGQSYNFSVSNILNPPGFTSGMGIFIDYNRNGVFTDVGEQVYITPALGSTVSHTETGSFTVPANASNGLARMRIVTNLQSNVTGPTMTVGWGEYEEYTVNLVGTGVITYTWNDGSTDIGTGNPLVVSPTVSTNYTVTASNPAGCTVVSTPPITVNVVAVPATPLAAQPSSQCGYGVPTVFAVGGADGSYNWYLTPSGGTPLPGEHDHALLTYAISTTTTFYVAITNGVCDGARAALIANVTEPDPVTAFVNGLSSTNSCTNTALSLTSVQTGSNNAYTYTWAASPAAGSGMPSSVAGQNQSVTPTVAGTYIYTVTAFDPNGSCTAVSSVTVVVNPQPVVTSVTATPSTVCAGATVTLNGQSIPSAAGNSVIGTGNVQNAVSTTTDMPPYGNYYTGNRHQMLVLASELTASGMIAGPITSLAFDVVSNTNALGYKNFTIKLGHTGATSLSTTFITTPTTQVYTNANYNPTPGINPHVFSSSFTWDGTSNLLVETYFSDCPSCSGTTCNTTGLGVSYTQNAVTRQTGTAVVMHSYYYSDGAGCQPETQTTASATSLNRPNMVFAAQIGSNVTNTLTWAWTSVPAGPTIPGNPVSVNPVVSTVYTATATIPATGCSNTGTVSVTVNPLPDAPTPNDNDQCGVGVPDASVSSNTIGSPVFHWYLTPTLGTFLAGELGPNLTAYSISTTTTFYVSEVSTFGCESFPRTAVTQTVFTPDPVTAFANTVSGSTSLCIGGNINLVVTETGGNNAYVYNWSVSPVSGSGMAAGPNPGDNLTVTPTLPGTYVYTVSAFDPNNECSNSSAVTVVVNPLPVIDSVRATPATLCAGETSTLKAYSGIVSSGPQTPPTGYCVSGFYSSGCSAFNDYIANVTFAGINRTSTCDAPGAGGAAGYSSYNSPVPNLAAGSTYPISLQMTPADTEGATVWIDYNRNGVFEASEVAFAPPFAGVASALYTGNVTIPLTASAGQTMMRVRCNWNEAPAAANACVATATWGEVEDYLVNIQGITTQNPAYTYQWNPGALPGHTVTVSPLSTQAYTVTVTNPATTCSSISSPVTVTVNPLPATPGATPSTQCGLGIPTASVTGSGGTFRWYDAASGGNLLQTGGSTYATAISTTTTFFVAEYNGTCESNRVAVTVTVTQPDPILAAVDDNAVCPNNPIQLSATKTSNANGNVYTYTWTASPAAGSGIPTSVSGSPVTVTPTIAGTYVYTATAFDPTGPCTTISTITVTVNPEPVITSATANPTTVCSTGSSTLTAVSIQAAAGSAPVGTPTTTTQAGSPFRAGGGSATKTQLLFTAAELQAAGFTTGNMTSVSFNFAVASGGTLPNFQIKMGHTAVSVLSNTFEPTPSTLVFAPTPVNPPTVTGPFALTFTAPFLWNGTSNILMEFCHDLPSPSSVSGSVDASVTAFVSTNQALNALACATTTGSSQTTRPLATLGGQVGTDLTSSYSWVWNTVPPGAPIPGSTVVVTPGTTKTYQATATNLATGCFALSSPVTVTVVAPSATATATPNVSCAGAPVVLNAVPAGGGPFTYKWYDVLAPGTTLSTNQSFTVNPLIPTTYEVIVTDFCNVAAAPASVTVTVNPLPTASIAQASPITICDPLTQGLTAVTSTGSPTYQWTLNGVNINLATGSSYTVSGVSTGTYRVRVTETTTGCSQTSAGVVVTINPSPSGVTAVASPNPICFGFSSTLTASSATPPAVALSQNWESGMGGWTAVNSSTGGTTPAATAWTIRPNPYTSTNSTPITFTNAGGGSSMILSNPDLGGSGVVTDNVLTSPVFSTMNYLTLNLTFRHFYRFLSATETFVEVSTNGTTWTNMKSYTATQGTFVTPQATFTSETINMNAYIGNPSVQIRFRYQDGWSWHWALDDIAVGGTFAGVNYSWSASPAPGSGMPVSVPGSPVSVTPTVAGSYVYTVTATNSFGCSTPASTTLVVNALPVLSINPVTTPVCFDAPAQTLSAVPSGGTFSGPGTSGPNGTIFTASAAGPGTHTITYSYTDGNGCSNTTTTSIHVNALPVAPTITGVNNTNGTSTITAAGYTGTLTWSNGGSDNPHIVNAAGSYTVTQTDANGCTSLPSNTFVAGPSITADPALGGMDITDLADVSQNANSLVHGQVYKLWLPVYNFEQDFPVPNGATKITIDLGSKLVLNPGFNLAAVTTLSPFFSWTHAVVSGHDILTGMQIADLPGDFDKTAVFEVVSSGSCTSLINANFIVDNHASVIALNDLVPINNNSKLQYGLPTTVSAVRTNVVCNGAADGTITVTPSEGTTVTVNGNPYNPLATYGPGTYTIVASAPSDIAPFTPCTATTSVTITEPPLLVPTIFAQTNVLGCFGDHTGAAAVFASGGTPGYTYSWNTIPVQTNAIATGLGAGTYIVTVTDANGCIKTASVTITEPAQVTGSITAQTNVDCFGNNNGSATVTPAGGTPGYTYSWNTTPVQTGATASGLVAGTYTVTITDTHGCTGTVTTTITEPPKLLVNTSVTNVTCFGLNNGSATASVTGGTPPYSYSWNTTPVQTDQGATGLAPGAYIVTVTDAHGCIEFGNVNITQPALLTISSPTHSNNSCHGGSTGTITAVAAGGTTAYTYTIAGPTVNTSGQSSGVFNGLTAGTYTVTVTDANGCVATTAPITITQPAGLLPDISLGSDYTANFFASNGTTNTIVYNVAEIAGNPAVGDTVRITKVAGYTFTFNTSLTSVTSIGPYTVDNTRWKVNNSNPAFVSLIFDPAHNSTPGTLNCGEVVYIAIDITRNTPNLSTFTLSARLRRANGEANLANNLNSIVFTAE